MPSFKLRRKNKFQNTPKIIKKEERDLYDQNHELTGKTIVVGDSIPKGYYVQVVMVFIQNSSGHYLIQKRTKQRNGMYATTGGHPKAGQTSLQGIVTEIEEELGIKVDPARLQLFYSGRSDEEQVFFDDYYLEANIPLNKLKLQKEEVQFASWFMRSEIKGLFKRGKLMSDHYEEYLRLQDWLEECQIAKRIIRKEAKHINKDQVI